jgi:hypothetical protein
MMFLRGLAVWCGIMLVETLHGILRVKILAPRVGDRRSRQLGVLTGSLLILAITFAMASWIGGSDDLQLLVLGCLWAALTVGFEIVLGRLVFRMSWKRIRNEFNPREGSWMPFGLLAMALAPWIATTLRDLL